MTTIAAARTLLITEGYTAEDVATAIDSLIDSGLNTPVAEQDGDSNETLVLEDFEIQTLREQIVSERGVCVGDIMAALDRAGIEYTVKYRGTSSASVHVGDLAMGPCVLDQDGNGLGVNTYAEGVGHDWHATITGAVERAAKYAR